ncbi:MAG: hypothetical protein PF541_18515 [Prolixibacteraceae bacterium]|jgi:hypothetical protein|nr:hypothetical protein [Prolixibacteraceae bacterium]
MKKIYALIVLVVLTISGMTSQAQVSTGVDIYSSYIWRGAKFGNGPAIQPYVDYTTGGLSVGAWGSVNASTEEALEMDLYAGYSFDFGLSVTVTDYYFGGDWLIGDSHLLEPMLSYSVGDFSITAAQMLTTGFDVDDTYLEASYSFGAFDLALGAGNGLYTWVDEDGDEEIGDEEAPFTICNISFSTSKEIEITEKFTLPVSGSVTLNPSTGGFFIAVGISL